MKFIIKVLIVFLCMLQITFLIDREDTNNIDKNLFKKQIIQKVRL